MLSTGVIGAPLPLDRIRAALPTAAAALSADGGDDAAEAILTTDTRTKQAVARGDGLHGRRDGEGLGDDPSQPRDDARGRHDRLPARAGRGDRRCCGRRSTTSFNSISVDGECSTNDAVVLLVLGRCDDRAHAGDRRRVRARAARGVRRPRRPDRRRRRGRDAGRRDLRHGRARPRRKRGRSRSGSRPRRSSRPRSSAATRTGAAC